MEDSAQMRSFIEVYKSMPELWNCQHQNYKNKNIRHRSYQKLLAEYKKVKRDCTFRELKKKIANMRTCYRRELKKVLKNKKSKAGGTNYVYVPTLWYFDAFQFLRDVKLPVCRRSSLSSDEEEEEDEDEHVLMNVQKEESPEKSSSATARIEFSSTPIDPLESSGKTAKIEDDASIYASGWACMFRQMSADQQLFAKRAIDEILFLGRLKQLSFNTVQINSI